MNREIFLDEVKKNREFDLVVVGGGATGLGVAVESAARGLRTLLLEQHDFCKATSSRSTKLVHGGVRYLAQMNVTLVMDALRERGILVRKVPHLVHRLPMVVPAFKWWEKGYYGIGLKLYDLLAGRLGLGKTSILSADEVQEVLPSVRRQGLRGGVRFFDGQFDDARLGITLLRTFGQLGGVALNYARMTGFEVSGGKRATVTVRDEQSDQEFEVAASVVVNATGPFADAVREMAQPGVKPRITVSRGSHVVLSSDHMPTDHALLVPKTDDGRVLFAIPWHGRLVVGTTDVEVDSAELEPRPSEEEVSFILEHVTRYLDIEVSRDDVLSIFAGLRPLVGSAEGATSALSRDHTIEILGERLISIMGGKWTTYRKMAEDTVDRAVELGKLEAKEFSTRELDLVGAEGGEKEGALEVYGSEAEKIRKLAEESSELGEKLHPRLNFLKAQVVWGVREEMALTLEDTLSRRTRALLLDAEAASECAPEVAALIARERGLDSEWEAAQVREFRSLARRYLPE